MEEVRMVRCDACGEEYATATPKLEMAMEMLDNFGDSPVDDELMELCDPCFQKVMARYREQQEAGS